jgi:hypothetical protein
MFSVMQIAFAKNLPFTFTHVTPRRLTAKTDATGGSYVKLSKRTQMFCIGSAKVPSHLALV